MGLDVTAYPTATLLPDHPEHREDCPLGDDGCYEAGHTRAFCYEGFEQSMRPLALSEPYQFSSSGSTFVGRSWYACDRAGAVGLHSGYGGHRLFREAICRTAHGIEVETIWHAEDQTPYRDLAFYELLHFADNEGTIGSEAAADLLRDFRDYAEKVVPVLAAEPRGEWLVELYHDWHKAFEVAAGGGLVDFH